jgi:shikimate dehydrogenase
MIDAHTALTGVLGYPVRHSLSPAMHNAAFRALELNWVYLAFEVAPDRLAQAIAGMRGLGIRGLRMRAMALTQTQRASCVRWRRLG